MKVSKNQIQNVSFSQKKEEVKPQQAELSVQDGEGKMAKSLDCLASQVPVVKKDSFAKQKSDLAERLEVLNTSTALHREYHEKDDERFGSDGIKTILDAVDSVEKLNIVNEQLDILEDTENPKSKNIWTSTIMVLIDPKYAEEMEQVKEEIPELFAPIMPEQTIDLNVGKIVQSESYREAYKQLAQRVHDIALDENRMPVNDEDLEKLIELADTEEKIAYVNGKLDKLDTDVVLKDSPHWASTIAEWLKQDFKTED